MADKPTTTAGLPPPKRNQTQSIPTFTQWSEGRTGFSKGELAEIYASSFGLAPEALKKLEGEIGAKATTTLIPKPVAKPKVPPQVITRPAPDLLIARTPYPKWWKDLIVGGIDITGNGRQVVVSGRGTRDLFVATIVLVVSGETHISFGFGGSAGSGSMYFGGGIQPGGIVISMSDSPAPCGRGGFSVAASGGDPEDPPHIGGFAVCFSEAEILPA